VSAPCESATASASCPLAASLLATAVVPLATAYALAKAIGVERSMSRRVREAKLFLGLFTAQVMIGAGIALIPGNLIDLLMDMQFLNGLITPILLTFILALANRHPLMGVNANTRRFGAVATVCTAAVAVLAVVVAGQAMLGWVGIA
jgi:Mn2+/Fe2+ NRAMP family transporter